MKVLCLVDDSDWFTLNEEYHVLSIEPDGVIVLDDLNSPCALFEGEYKITEE